MTSNGAICQPCLPCGWLFILTTERKNMNTIKLPVSELKTALTGLGKIISRKTTLPVLQHVRVSRDDKGEVQLQSMDLDTFITYHSQDVQSGSVMDVLV